jgi:hypothetical protein
VLIRFWTDWVYRCLSGFWATRYVKLAGVWIQVL